MRLLRSDIPERGTIYASRLGPILFPKKFLWKDTEGLVHILEKFELTIPGEGTLQCVGMPLVYDFLWHKYKEESILETDQDFKRRLKHQMSKGLSLSDNPEAHSEAENFRPEWTDFQFSNPNRYILSETLEGELESLYSDQGKKKPTSAAEKLTQAKYRQKPEAKTSAKDRRRISLDANIEMRKASKWIKEHPGKTFSDWLELEEVEVEGESDAE